MKRILKAIFIGIISVIVIIDVIVTAYLINFNEYNVSQIRDYSIIVVDKNIEGFKKNELLFIKKNNNDEIKTNDHIFYYNIADKDNIINYGKVYNTYKVNDKETTFTVEDNKPVSSQYVIGKGETASSVEHVGSILAILASRWGYLFLIIFPIAILLVVQTYLLYEEIKKEKRG